MNQRGGRGQYTPRGRSPRPTGGRSPHYRAHVGADGYPVDDSFGSNDGMSRGGRTNPQQRSRGGVSNHFEAKPSTGFVYRQKQPGAGGAAGFSNVVRHQEGQSSVNPTGGDDTGDSVALCGDISDKVGADGYPVDDSFGSSDGMSRGGRTNPQRRSQGGISNHFEPKPSTGFMYRQKQPGSGGAAGFSNVVRHQEGQSSVNPTGGNDTGDSVALCGDFSEKVKVISHQDESRSNSKSGAGVGVWDSVNKGMKNTEDTGNPNHPKHVKEVGADGDDSFGCSYGMSRGGRTNSQQRSHGGVSSHFKPKPFPRNMYKQKQPASRGGAGFSNVIRHQQGQSSVNPVASDSVRWSNDPENPGARTIQCGDDTGDSVGLPHDFSDKVKIMSQQDESRLNSKSGAGVGVGKNGEDTGNSDHPEKVEEFKRFDLCPSKGGSSFKLRPSLLESNREKRNEIKRSHEGQHGSVLRPGMVLLKKFLSLNDQIKIVKQSRDLGIGTGGFYQPGYGDGRELHLKMMCLGKNWDPETSKYLDIRPHDHATPPQIPNMFSQLVLKAIEDSHTLIRTQTKVTNIQNALPSMSPNICIINFYTATGRLGLHQDKDESLDSLRKGLPVVSFSIGDSAEFLYGDERDVEKAERVVLESGDLLIFGGKSRHVFHGVSSIRSDTAPKALLEETNLRPGRLNLTFREY